MATKRSIRDNIRVPFQWGIDGGLAAASEELGFAADYFENYLKGQVIYKDAPASPIVIDGGISTLSVKPKSVSFYFDDDNPTDIKRIVADWGKSKLTIATNSSARHYAGVSCFFRLRLFLTVSHDDYPPVHAFLPEN